jgi:hypothetical protein
MAYDEKLAARLRALLEGEPDLTEQPMFGGLAFLIAGHMAVAASGSGGLLLRVAPEEVDRLLDDPHAQPFLMRDRPVEGWLRILSEGTEDDGELARWVAVGRRTAGALAPKRRL